MTKSDQKALADHRRDQRIDIAAEVTISFDEGRIVGPGHNISAQGVYFTTEKPLRVHVGVTGSDRKVAAEIVRVESMGNGIYGFAVRFLEPYERQS